MNEGSVKSSIIIITYNNWNDTKLCLDSVFTKTGEQEFEVIVVDNASQDGTPDFLQAYAHQYPSLQLELNAKNEGFARANNQGAMLARGDYLVFLNNDTVVTPGWLSGLISHLDKPRVGMVGPVTNSSSNESRVSVAYESLDELDAFAEKYTSGHVGQAFEIRALAFFCVGLRRAVFEEIGPLDERFGLGMFEDDDYAMRLRNAGYMILCAEDVFVHHTGGRSFLKLDYAYYWRLFHENRAKFEDKWGVKWQPHVQRDEYLREQVVQTSEHSLQLQWALIEQMDLVTERDRLLRMLRKQSNQYANNLDAIYTSRTWRFVEYIRRLRRFFIPENSFREKIFIRVIGTGNWVRHRIWLRGKAEEALPQDATQDQISNQVAQDSSKARIEVLERQVPILIPQFFNFAGDQLYIGGAERYLVELVSLINSLGSQSIVYQSARERWTREYEGIPVIGLPNRGDFQLLNQLFHDEISPGALAIYFAFYLAVPNCNPRSIGISHGVYWDTGNNQPLVDQRKRLELILDPIANLSQIVSVDTNTINWIRGIQSYLTHKFVYIPNFVDVHQFKSPIEKRSDDKLVILYPRRLYEPRGFWLVKEIVPEFIQKNPNIEFHFVGQAEKDAEAAVNELIELYPQNVRWYSLSFDEMYRAYQAAAITLIPTVHSEGTSLSCLEAMAAGNAVIASHVGGLPDLVISGYNGILIEPTVSGLREALNLLCQNENLRDLMGNRAKEVAKSFSLNQWQIKWTKLLKQHQL